MVFQSYALYPHLSVRENMAFGLKVKKTPADKIAEAREQHAAATARLALLEEAKKLADEL